MSARAQAAPLDECVDLLRGRVGFEEHRDGKRKYYTYWGELMPRYLGWPDSRKMRTKIWAADVEKAHADEIAAAKAGAAKKPSAAGAGKSGAARGPVIPFAVAAPQTAAALKGYPTVSSKASLQQQPWPEQIEMLRGTPGFKERAGPGGTMSYTYHDFIVPRIPGSPASRMMRTMLWAAGADERHAAELAEAAGGANGSKPAAAAGASAAAPAKKAAKKAATTSAASSAGAKKAAGVKASAKPAAAKKKAAAAGTGSGSGKKAKASAK